MPEVDSEIVYLIETPELLRLNDHFSPDFRILYADADGLHGAVGKQCDAVPITLLGGAAPDKPLSALIQIDELLLDRLEAVTSFVRAIRHLPTSDGRMTPDKRRRLRLILRVADGRASGASTYDIAETLFGKHLVERSTWDFSPYRANVFRLIQDGEKMIHDDYRSLLKHRRRS